MKTLLFVSSLISIVIYSPSLSFGQKNTWLSPGIKLGHTFGPGGGLTYGIELSYTAEYSKTGRSFFVGWIFDLDYCNGTTKALIGFEAAYWNQEAFPSIGLSIGPSFIVGNGKEETGINFITFAGFGGYFYYGYTMGISDPELELQELGLYLKRPILQSGPGVKLAE